MPFNTKNLNYTNAEVEVKYVMCTHKLSDLLTKEEYDSNNDKELRELLQQKIDSFTPTTLVRVYIEDDSDANK